MRSAFVLGWVALALAAGAACAASEDGESPDPDAAPPPIITDADPADAGREDTSARGPATCSGAGWCVTLLPDTDLTMIDVWPFQERAFAVARSGTLGVKVMEWIDADQRWTYIDDNTQNEDGLGKYVGRIWAPNADEVYYSVSPGYIYHGKRAGSWTWERRLLTLDTGDAGTDWAAPAAGTAASPAVPASAALGVWGTSADDVYAWRANTIFHWKSRDGGALDWVPEYVGQNDSPLERVFVLSAGGSSKDDVWFGGARGSRGREGCPVVLRKTRDGYRHVVDGVLGSPGVCEPRPGTLHVDGAGAMLDIQPAGAGGVVGLRYADTVTRVMAEDDGGYSAVSTTLPTPIPYERLTLYSLWLDGEDVWLSGTGLILRGPLTGDADAYGISTVALTGAPLDKPLYRVRGTGSTNLWAIGARYAFHKTTP